MTERQAFVNAIKAHPRDFTPRLVFADWLDEQPDPTDLDRATAEFIRISCKATNHKTSTVMPKEAYPWLHENWRRLIPQACAAIRPHNFWWRRNGRVIYLRTIVPAKEPFVVGNHVGGRVEMLVEYLYGFVDSITHFRPYSKLMIDAMTADQPIARVYDPWARVDPAKWGIGDILPGLLPDQLPHPLP